MFALRHLILPRVYCKNQINNKYKESEEERIATLKAAARHLVTLVRRQDS